MNRPTSSFAGVKSPLFTLALAGLVAFPAAGAFAQSVGAQPTIESSPGAQPATAQSVDPEASKERGQRGHRDPAAMQARQAERQAQLKNKLRLTPEQEPAWSSFTVAMQPPARALRDAKGMRAELEKLPTPERVDRMRAERTQRMAEMSKRMDERGEATKRFYSALTAEQKKTFDDETLRMGAGHGQRRGPGGSMQRG